MSPFSLPDGFVFTGLFLHGPCEGNHDCQESMKVLSYPKDTILFWSSPTSGSYSISTLSPIKGPELWDCCDRDVQFVAEHSQTYILCTEFLLCSAKGHFCDEV